MTPNDESANDGRTLRNGLDGPRANPQEAAPGREAAMATVWQDLRYAVRTLAKSRGFAGVDCEIMAYLNSDDMLMPGTLAYVAGIFHARPDVDIVYGHRIFINSDGLEVGRAVLPSHHAKTLMWADYIPQETLFWRRRVWDAVGPIDENFNYALDWDFLLRAQAAGFKFVRLPRFLACFRVHDAQKTAAMYDVGRQEMQTLRSRYLGCEPTQRQIYRAAFPYLARQLVWHWMHRIGILRY
jgi:hypothetical protein